MPRITGTQLGPGVYLPILTCTLELSGASDVSLSGPALIDSGADKTIIPYEILEAAGIPFDALSLTQDPGLGAGGQFEVRTCPGTLYWRKWEIASSVSVAEKGMLPFALLGRADFFEKFVVRFRWHSNPPTIDVDPIT